MLSGKTAKIAAQIALLATSSVVLSGCAAGHSKAFGEICDNTIAAQDYSLKWSQTISPDAIAADRKQVFADFAQQFKVDSSIYAYTMAMYAEKISEASAKLDASESEMKEAAEQTLTDAEKFKEDLRTYLTQFNAEPIDWMLSSTSTTTDFVTLSSLCLAN